MLSNGSPVASGTYYQSVALQTSGLKTFSVEAKVYGAGSQRVGVFIGGVFAYFARFGSGNYGVRDADSNGETNGDTETTFAGGGLSSGDTLKMQIQETSTGIFDVGFFRNGTLINALFSQAYSIGTIVNTGVYSELGGEWDDLTCACDQLAADTCAACPAIAAVWTLTVDNVQNATCTQCTLINRTTFLYFQCAGTIACQWQTAETLNCNATVRPLWLLTVLSAPASGVYARLQSGSRAVGTCGAAQGNSAASLYTLSTPFNCLSDNVFTHVNNSPGCTNFPTTITISPA